MAAFIWIVMGALVGWLASQIMMGSAWGVRGDMIVGAVGGLMGGVLFRSLGPGTPGFFGTLIVAIFGSVALLYGAHLFKKPVPVPQRKRRV